MQKDIVIQMNFDSLKKISQNDIHFAKSKHKSSKIDAFLYLISEYNLQVIAYEKKDIETTYQQLAEIWKWDRTTVKRFLDFLIKLNLVQIQVENKKLHILLKCILQ